MRQIFTIMLLFNLFLYADIIRDNSKEIVTDTTTNLQWQDNIDAKTVTKTWKEAIDYCKALKLGGYTNWRLPNIKELKSIIDRRYINPTISKSFKNTNITDFYWSSTTLTSSKYYARTVGFNYGYIKGFGKRIRQYIRCVRNVK